jgi:hypothetical protein
MAQWGMNDRANNSPIFATSQVNLTTTAINANTLFGNTTVGAFVNGGLPMKKAVGVFGISISEVGNTVSGGTKAAHAGWNMRTAFTGPLTSVTIATAGRLYTNNDTYSIAAGTGGTNQAGNVVTNATGNLVSYTVTTAGANFQSATPTVTISVTSGGTTGSITATAGGRAGRVQIETLVAASSITGDSDGTIF